MKITLVLLLAGLSVCLAVPAKGKAASSCKAPTQKIYDVAQDMVKWAKAVVDATNNAGLDANEIKALSEKEDEISSKFEEALKALKQAVKTSGCKVPKGFGEGITEKVTAMVKKDMASVSVQVDQKLALLSGDPLVADDMRLSMNLDLFSKRIAALEETVAQLKALLDGEPTDQELFKVLDQLMVDCTALTFIFDNIVGSFEDANNLLAPKGEDSHKTQKRFRRWSYNLGRGWSIGSRGVTWRRTNRYGRFYFNARPTWSSSGFGFRARFSWSF